MLKGKNMIEIILLYSFLQPNNKIKDKRRVLAEEDQAAVQLPLVVQVLVVQVLVVEHKEVLQELVLDHSGVLDHQVHNLVAVQVDVLDFQVVGRVVLRVPHLDLVDLQVLEALHPDLVVDQVDSSEALEVQVADQVADQVASLIRLGVVQRVGKDNLMELVH